MNQKKFNDFMSYFGNIKEGIAYIQGPDGKPLYFGPYDQIPEEALQEFFGPDLHDWRSEASFEIEELPFPSYQIIEPGATIIKRGDYVKWAGKFRPANSQWFGLINEREIFRRHEI